MPQQLISPELTLYQALHRVIQAYPNKPALTFGEQTLTFREFGAQVDALARKLRGIGVQPGDKVALLLPNCLEFVYAFFALPALGAVIVPLNPVYRQKEIQHILNDSEASVVIADAKVMGNDLAGILSAARPALAHLRVIVARHGAIPNSIALGELKEDATPLAAAKIKPDDLCALVYTSGTTGVPKAVMHSHRSMIAAAAQGEYRFKDPLPIKVWNLLRLMRQYDARFIKWGLKQYAMLVPTPMHALIGYGAVLYGVLYGFRTVIAERFHPAHILELIEREHITALTLAPSMVQALIHSDEFARRDHSSVLAINMAAAPCPPDLVRQARQMFGCPVMISFGATEVGGITLATNLLDPENLQSETVGTLFAGMNAQVVDAARCEVPRGEVGELALKLGSTMLGYYKTPELTAQTLDHDGWYYTGDLATMDEKGYVRIVGRKKDMIIRGGQNIYPAEIENHLLAKPGIASVAIVGVPAPIAGEHTWAFVVPQEGELLTPAQVLDYCRSELAPYKVPDQVRIVRSLPTTATGKVQKFQLREMAMQELANTRL